MGGNSSEPADGLARSFWPSPAMAEDLVPMLPHIAERTPVRTPVRGVPGRPSRKSQWIHLCTVCVLRMPREVLRAG
jgi:hypothetical protein